ncbi:MAG TPA: hypothetical protein VHQ21_07580 [Rhodanobacteraceae bacterium]|jgi:hypothetical protein|nr:hypothetical protein [Rhodanobacteraceae bacterium]
MTIFIGHLVAAVRLQLYRMRDRGGIGPSGYRRRVASPAGRRVYEDSYAGAGDSPMATGAVRH